MPVKYLNKRLTEMKKIKLNIHTLISLSLTLSRPSLEATLSGCTALIIVPPPGAGAKLNPNLLFQPRFSSTITIYNKKDNN